YQKWIGKKQEIISKALKEAKTVTLNSTRSIEELKILVNEIARMSQAELNTHINRIYFKKMKTKWASHSKNNNLTVNTLLKYLPEDLISYVIFHETAHSVERKHNTNFWELVKRKYPDYQVKEEKLLTYWFLIQEITNKQMTRAR
ncbi:MAG: M48 family metallopeptidase, partial [Candidatus Methanosuratincola petrocarbonis]